jgi:hypothetical protein
MAWSVRAGDRDLRCHHDAIVIAMIGVGAGRTHPKQGAVQLVIVAAFVVLSFLR